MKWQVAFLGLIAAAGVLQADINDDTFSGDGQTNYDNTPGPTDNTGPFTLRASFDYFGNAEISKRSFRGDKLRFAEYDVDGSWVFCYNECKKEGISLEAGYSHFDLDWHQNPYFDETHFNMVSVGLGFFTKRAWAWDWKALAKMNFNPDHLDFQNYVTWDLMAWGRYELASDWGFHAGVLVLTGMKIDRVYPIIGLDWKINDTWHVNAIFPMNFSVIYNYNCNLSFALASRFWDIRQRVGNSEPLRKATWEYRNFGGEFGATYKLEKWVFNAHVGYSSGGKLNISNRHKKHTHRIDFDGAPYAGAEAAVNF